MAALLKEKAKQDEYGTFYFNAEWFGQILFQIEEEKLKLTPKKEDLIDNKIKRIPDPYLTYREFKAIKIFNPSDFERSSYTALSLPISGLVLFFFKRIFR